MEEIKYLVFGGNITSKNDGDEHFIGAQRLVELYGVNPKNCILDNPQGTPKEIKNRRDFLIRNHPKAMILLPTNGDYRI